MKLHSKLKDTQDYMAAKVATLKKKLEKQDYMAAKQDCMVAENATLKKKVEKQQNTRMQMKKAFTYVENQFFIF